MHFFDWWTLLLLRLRTESTDPTHVYVCVAFCFYRLSNKQSEHKLHVKVAFILEDMHNLHFKQTHDSYDSHRERERERGFTVI